MTPPRIHYAWYVAAVAFMVLLCAAAVRSTPSVIIVPLQNDFGWSRTLISGAISTNLVIYGMVGPFAAAIMQRFGIRRTMIAALAIMATGVALTTRMTTPWQLYASWGVLVGIATGSTATVLGATVVQRWFVSRRGLVIGALAASAATGQLVFLPIMASYIASDGWRSVVLVIALCMFAMIPIVGLLVRDRPADIGVLPYGADPANPPPSSDAVGNPFFNALGALRRATHHRDFWLLAASFFICGATTNGLIGTHLVPACMDHGIPEVRAAGLLAVMGIFDLFGTTASGWLSDRFDSRKLLFAYYGLRGLALLWLPQAFDAQLFGLPLFAEVPSNALTAIEVPAGVDGGAVVKTMEQRYGVKIAGGQDQLKGKIFRLGHIGYYDDGDILRLVGAFESALIDHGFGAEPGTAVRAAQQSLRGAKRPEPARVG